MNDVRLRYSTFGASIARARQSCVMPEMLKKTIRIILSLERIALL